MYVSKEKRKNFSCEGCPSASLCGKTSCNDMLEVTVEMKNQASESVKLAAAEAEKEADRENG